MKRAFAVFSMLALLILAGCAETPDQAVRKMRLEQRTVFSQSRLFSTVGFWVLDEPVRQKVMAAYGAGGVLNRGILRANFPEGTFAKEQDCVMITLGSGTVPVFVVTDGPLIALDPSQDEMVHRLAQDYAHDGKTVPVVGK
jgi:ABC-type histidine transport system ATPase subunit